VPWIYGLVDPICGDLRYIGQTREGLSERYRIHIRNAQNNKRDSYSCRWIKTLLRRGTKPTLIVIEQTDDASNRERFWIKHYKAAGCRLTNLTEGGEDGRFMVPRGPRSLEAIAKTTAANTGKKRSPEICRSFRRPKPAGFSERMSARLKGIPRPETAGERNGEARLTADQVREIRHRYVPRLVPTTQLAREYGVSQAQIWRIVKGKSWPCP
jgi:hypothetical protein